MSRKQFSVPTSTHTPKKTRKEQKAELKAAQEEFARQQQEQGVMMPQNQAEVEPLINTPEDEAQFKKLILWASGISILLLIGMYFYFN